MHGLLLLELMQLFRLSVDCCVDTYLNLICSQHAHTDLSFISIYLSIYRGGLPIGNSVDDFQVLITCVGSQDIWFEAVRNAQ